MTTPFLNDNYGFSILRLRRRFVKFDKFLSYQYFKIVAQVCISYWCISIIVQVFQNILHKFEKFNWSKKGKIRCNDYLTSHRFFLSFRSMWTDLSSINNHLPRSTFRFNHNCRSAMEFISRVTHHVSVVSSITVFWKLHNYLVKGWTNCVSSLRL